jgi:hypothetical protein
MQCDIFMAEEKGKWIIVDGRAGLIQPNGFVMVHVGEHNHGVQCLLPEKWRARLATIQLREPMKITGKIVGYINGILTLDECGIE